MKNILIVGAGGREHALAHTLQQDPRVQQIIMLGSSGVISDKITVLAQTSRDHTKLLTLIEEYNIDLTLIGPEQPLSEGIVDFLNSHQHPVFGPHQFAAQLESSKTFSKAFMNKYQIPTAQYETYTNYETAVRASGSYGYPEVIKADGLCAGKGVYICQDYDESKQALKEIFLDKRFDQQGNTVVLEQYLSGFEASLLCFVSKDKLYPMETSMDYKKVYDGDQGPNTGGVGCMSPNPFWNEYHQQQSQEILEKIEHGLKQENLGYAGILFIGYLVENDRVYVLEFNTRFGDPETEVLLPRLQSNLLDHIQSALMGESIDLHFDDKVSVGVILFSKGYPNAFEKGKVIKGLKDIDPDILVFQNGTKKEENQLYSNGGRVLTLVHCATNYEASRMKIYENIKNIKFDGMSYRNDIGFVE